MSEMDHKAPQVPSKAKDARTRSARFSSLWTARVASLVVLLSIAATSLVSFGIARGAVREDEKRLLAERTTAISAVMLTEVQQISTQLQVLGIAATVHLDHARDVIATVASIAEKASQLQVLALAQKASGSYRLLMASGPAAPRVVTADREALLARAESHTDGAIGLFSAGPVRVLAVAVAVGPYLVWSETPVSGSTPLTGAENPFKDVRGALYIGRSTNVNALALTTEGQLPVRGKVATLVVPFGADAMTLVIGSKHALVGAWAARIPWLVLISGMAIAVAMAIALYTSMRRRDYAREQVQVATKELETRNQDLRRARRFLDGLVTSGPVVVLKINPARRMTTYASPNLESRFGFTVEDVWKPGFPFDVLEPDDRERFEVQAASIAEACDAESATLELRVRMPDRSTRWVSVVLVPTSDDDGEVLAYVLDVDERHKAEEAQRQAARVAEAANRSKTEFVSRMSHELRTPLNAVLGYGQLLEMDDLNESQKKAVAYILSGGRHLLELINEILDISAIEVGRLDLHLEPVHVNEMVCGVVGLVQPIAEATGVTVTADSCDQAVVLADPQRLRQILINLLTNAVKYNHAGGEVVVRCRGAVGGRIDIGVTDTGVGIPHEKIELAFAPFERLGAQSTGVEGKGIGLWLSRRLAEAMGGTLSCDSAVDVGTTFTLSLPQSFDGARAIVASPLEATGPAHERTTVLQIDDQAANRELVEMIFERRDDIDLVTASMGEDGLRLARSTHPALVLLDLNLPDIDGPDVLRRLRADPETRNIPIVIVSADATPAQQQRLVQEGAAAYLTKPLNVDELLTVVRDLVDAR